MTFYNKQYQRYISELVHNAKNNYKLGNKLSLHPNCHYQMTYCKFNLFTEYRPPYEQQVWDYKHADTSSIRKSLNQLKWNQLYIPKPKC